MSQREERKREYNKLRQRRLRGYGDARLGFAKVSPQRGGESERGVVPDVVPPDTKRQHVVPPIIRGNVVPIPMNPRTMSKRKLVAYLAAVGAKGFSLVETARGFALVANTGELVPFDGVAALERTVRVHSERIMVLEAEMARLEAMLDSVLHDQGEREGARKWTLAP